MNHRRAVWLLVAATLLWSMAGVVTRHLDAARGFEVTFWRSAFNAVALVGLLAFLRGPVALRHTLLGASGALWLSGVCWGVMFTAFMLALTLTTVAHVLVTMSIGPLLTALGARLLLRHRLAARTWWAIAMAGVGIGWMYGSDLGSAGLGSDSGTDSSGARQAWLGTLVALAVPLAAAANWTLLQHLKSRDDAPDMLGAVLIGALLSALCTLPMAWPLSASLHDLSLLALLGVFQLAIPCLMAVAAARVLSAPEISLLGLLEVVFGVLWAWLGAGETPTLSTLGGGLLVLLALVGNEALGLQRRRPTGPLAGR